MEVIQHDRPIFALGETQARSCTYHHYIQSSITASDYIVRVGFVLVEVGFVGCHIDTGPPFLCKVPVSSVWVFGSCIQEYLASVSTST